MNEDSKSTLLLLALIVTVVTLMYSVGLYQDSQKQKQIDNCINKYGDHAAYNWDGSICLNSSQHEEKILSIIENNQPMTIQSISQTTDLSHRETETLLQKMAEEGKVYSYDRGWSYDGWKILKNNSEEQK